MSSSRAAGAALRMLNRDPYLVLGISRSASVTDVRTAFVSAAKKCHPDHDPSPGATARFQELQTAFEILRDPNQRRLYDLSQSPYSASSSSAASAPRGSSYQRVHFSEEDSWRLKRRAEAFKRSQERASSSFTWSAESDWDRHHRESPPDDFPPKGPAGGPFVAFLEELFRPRTVFLLVPSIMLMSWLVSSTLSPVDAYRPSPSSREGSFSAPKLTITGTTWRNADTVRTRPKNKKSAAEPADAGQQQVNGNAAAAASPDAATAAGIVAISAAAAPSAIADSIVGKTRHPPQ